jgi:hypothetical protein
MNVTEACHGGKCKISEDRLIEIKDKFLFQIDLDVYLKRKEIATIERRIAQAEKSLAILRNLESSGRLCFQLLVAQWKERGDLFTSFCLLIENS